MYKKRLRFVLRNFEGFYGYLVGMAVEVATSLVLMGIGLLISILGIYLLK